MVLEMELMKMVEANRTKLLILLVFLMISCRTKSTVYNYDVSKTEFCQNTNGDFCNTGIYKMGFTKFFVQTPNYFEDPISSKRKKNIFNYCSIRLSNDSLFERNCKSEYISRLELIITEKKIIFDYLINYFPDNIKEEILYSYSNNRDSIFKNLINFDSKVIIDKTIYYYPLKDTSVKYAVISVINLNSQYKLIEFIEALKTVGYFIDLKHIHLKSLFGLGIYIPLIEQKK